MAKPLGIAIKSILDNHEPFYKITPSLKVEAVFAEQGRPYPAVVFNMDNVSPSDVKGYGSKKDIYTYSIRVVSEDYDEAHEIDTIIREALDHQKGNFSGIEVDGIQYIGSQEAFDASTPNAYIVVSQFKIRVTR